MVKMTAPTYNLAVEHVVSYLKLGGWKLVHDNKRWYVFEGYEDIEGNPFEIVLPKNTRAPDYSIYVQQTVNILSSLTDKTPETITNDMLFYDRDILIVRVVERIARGLAATEKAVNLQDVQPLIDGYAEGFNANMCAAILKMLDEQKEPIEYSIKWSHKIEVSDDVRNINNIPIQQRHFEYLETASKKLKELEPESKTIEGLVIGLSSSGDPLSEDVAERSILVK